MGKSAVLSRVILIAGSLAGCGPVDEPTAREHADQAFVQTCTNLRYPSSAFLGPFKTTIGGAAFSYEWHTKDPKGIAIGGPVKIYGVLVGVTSDGETNASLLDRPPSR